MKRFHLFEFEDFSWFPEVIRDGGTDFLGFLLTRMNFYLPAVPLLEDAIKQSDEYHILDFCSGNGGPISLLEKNIDSQLQVQYTLTDKFPNTDAYTYLKSTTNGSINYVDESVDILNNNLRISGVRTLFTAIHHFNKDEVKLVFSQAVNDQTPIAVFDGGDKHLGSILAIIISHPILLFVLTPFFKPFKLSRFLFTYLIPIIPLYVIWDGIVSILRLYHHDELLEIAKQSDKEEAFNWKSGTTKNSFGFSVAYLIGIPKRKS